MSEQVNKLEKELSNDISDNLPSNIKHVWLVAYPLMISALSEHLMLTADRYILSRYSTDAAIAVGLAGMASAIFHLGGTSIANIATVLSGRYNGSKEYHKVASPVWQMMYFSIMLTVLFVPLAYFAGDFVIHPNLMAQGMPYFFIMMLFGFIFPLNSAIASFFISIKSTKLVTISIIGSNIINLILNFPLVFGVEGFIPSMGSKGAAIATIIAQIFQFCFLLYFFLSAQNRKKYHTSKYAFNKEEFWECLKIGLPSAVGMVVEISAWATLYYIMESIGRIYSNVLFTTQQVFILSYFLIEGTRKAITTISANLIGANRAAYIYKAFLANIVILLLGTIALSSLYIFYPDLLIYSFLSEEIPMDEVPQVVQITKTALKWALVYLFIDGVCWTIAGTLTALKDTRFVMIISSTCVWILAIIPCYILLPMYNLSADKTWVISCIYLSIQCVIFYYRFKQKVPATEAKIA